MELQAAFFLKYFKRQQFQYRDPHYLIDFRVSGIKTFDLKPFSLYHNFNIVITKMVARNFMTGVYDIPVIKLDNINIKRRNSYIRVDAPQVLRNSFSIFQHGNFPYRIIIKNIRWDLK